ncbi:hypothetical protein V5O48_012872 [Marasmius crinis-equi]|uniref:Uncharacterized protein n=1 Tax=Marasmius crinis-equi TaxID=585013 RepID=A0ABR3F1V5_9AGAR
MLKLSDTTYSCQQKIGTGNGFDAGDGAYQIYLNANRPNNAFCTPQGNRTLPQDIQSAICNNNIKIYDDLYSYSFWDTGAWFYITTVQEITKDTNADPNKIFTKCPQRSSSTTSVEQSSSASSSSTSTSTSSPDASSDSGGLGTGAKAGIAVGIVVLAIVGALATFFYCRRRKRTRQAGGSGPSLNQDDGLHARPPPPASSAYSYTPTATSPSHDLSTAVLGTGTSSDGLVSGSGTGETRGSTAPLFVSNPDYGAGSRTQRESESRPLPAPPSKGNTGRAYVPSAVSSSDMSERHTDAGPVGAGSLQRNTSGRLPPAYDDLVRE